MNVDIENTVKNCSLPHETPGKPWEVIVVDLFTINSSSFFCVVDYHNKFPMVKWAERLSTDSLILCCEIIFAENRLLKKIMPDAENNFV